MASDKVVKVIVDIWSAEVFDNPPARASAPTPAPPEEGTDALHNLFYSAVHCKIKRNL